MRNWAIELQTQQRLAEERELTHVPQLIHPYIVISREAGTDASGLAHEVGAKCGWKVLDSELLDYMAEHDHLSRFALDFVDERAVSWFHEMFGKWLEKQLISQAEYVGRLGRLVLLAAQHESTIFVGRGVQFLLPRDRGLIVRIIAPAEQRIRCVSQKRQCNEHEAKEFIEATDYGREQFVQRYFHHNVAEPHLYDLIINLAHIPRDEAVDLVVTQVKRHQQRVLDQQSGIATEDLQFRRPGESQRPK